MSKKKLTVQEIVDRGMITDASVARAVLEDPSLLNTPMVKEFVTQQADYLEIYGDDELADVVELETEEPVKTTEEPVKEEPKIEEHEAIETPVEETPDLASDRSESETDEKIDTEEVKDLAEMIQEDMAATPGNTTGMGNPCVDDGTGKGTEPIPTAKKGSKKKSKKSEEE